jgi:hypothetical protein
MAQCKCGSDRIVNVSAKCNDMCDVSTYADCVYRSTDGYVKRDMGIGGGDYIEFSYCLNCGQIQGTFPRPETELEQVSE